MMKKRLARNLRWLVRTFFISVFIGVSCAAFSAAQQEKIHPTPDDQQPAADGLAQRQRPTPPKVAVDACVGKKEGDPCAFSAPEGLRNGECLSGVEKIFACRPFRGESPQPVDSNSPVQPGPSRPSSRQDAGTEPGNRAPSARSTPKPAAIPTPALEKAPPSLPVLPASPAKPVESQPDSLAHLTPRDVVTSGSAWAYVGVAFLSALITWFFLSRYFALPLRRLRSVTQQLAGGDLSARVGEGLVHRKDYVADLARDVDRMAERTESLVGAHQRLIRDVSHELRSPLARLNVALELARQSAGSEHPAPFDRIERESERLNELIGQLLMLTRLESDSNISQREDVDIAALIRDVAHDVDFEAQSTNRRVVVKAAEGMVLSGNRELLRQALENLVRNAARYTEENTEVDISLLRKQSGGRSWAHVEVRDHGPGVPEAVLYDIFRPFYRVSDSRERQSGGTGVGLAISDRAVRLHGGSLRAFNAPGGGLIMEMELPLQ